MRYFKYLGYISLSLLLLFACNKNYPTPKLNEQIRFIVPSNFPPPKYTFEGNALTNSGFALGKRLFYDARLSADKSVSCGSCHQQFAAFAQLDHAVSHGVNNCLGKRNAPPLFNLAWQKEFFWDGGGKNLETVPINAITDACEMGTSLNNIIAYLNQTSPYPSLFKDAFGSETVTSQVFLKALAQFIATMVSANSKYDMAIRGTGEYSFSQQEFEGYTLFKEKCASCHKEPLFTNLDYKNNGLDLTSSDEGRMMITGFESDKGKFRVPSLRNSALTSPYMHDGRFSTLEQVIDHYNSGVKAHANLDPQLKRNGTLGIAINIHQKQLLIGFLKTLTDESFIKNKAFSEN